MGKNLKILVPFDGSEYSKRALDKAIEIAKDGDSILQLLMAVSPPAAEPPGIAIAGLVKGKGATVAIREFIKQAFDRANNILEQNVDYCRRKGVDARSKVVGDHPANAILEYSKRNNIDLIVMGSKGLRGIKKIKVLGSVSRHVLENASCPVLIVH